MDVPWLITPIKIASSARLIPRRWALSELGIEWIAAHSPQAKGRIEPLFKTLQDRLVKQMRLAGIDSIEGANHFLAITFFKSGSNASR
jgi:hypothetical protein